MKNNINSLEKVNNFFYITLITLIVLKRYVAILFDNTNLLNLSKYILLICILISIIIIFIDYKKIKKINIIILSILATQFLITNNGVLLFSYISILALKEYDREKAITTYLNLNLFLFLLLVVLNILGFRESTMFGKSNDLGFGNPNTAYISFYLIWLCYLYLKFDKKSLTKILIITITPIIMYFITYSRTGLITIIVTTLLYFMIKYYTKSTNEKFKKVILITLVFMPIMITILSLVISYGFNNNIPLNRLLSGRPMFWNSYLTNIDKPLNLIGYDNNIRSVLMNGESPLDSGYISGLYINGILIYSLFILLYSYNIYCIYTNKNKKALIMTISILIYSFSESITLDLSTNISLLFLMDSINNLKLKNNRYIK